MKRFLASQQRGGDWHELSADADATYDAHDEINLSELEPLIACPTSPDNVVAVHEVAGKEIYQAYIGSSANPGLRDFAIAALMVDGKQVHDAVSFDINPTSRQILENLIRMGLLAKLIRAGARLHQAGCNGCIGMGQAPPQAALACARCRATSRAVRAHKRTTSTCAALKRRWLRPSQASSPIHAPSRWRIPRFEEPERVLINTEMLAPPTPAGEQVALVKGPNIQSLPPFEPLPDSLEGPVLIKLGDNVSTDEIMPAGEQVLPYRSNIAAISKFVFRGIDASYYERAMRHQQSGSLIVGGRNYGQGSSREHAAIGPRYLGVKAVVAKSFARIHWQNLINFGILPLTFTNLDDWHRIAPGDILRLPDVREAIQRGNQVRILNQRKNETYMAEHAMTDRQVQMLLAGSLINLFRARHAVHGV